MLQGFKVNTPTANYGISVRGVFDSQRDAFDPARHQLVGKVNPGKQLRTPIGSLAGIARLIKDEPRPVLKEYVDLHRGGCPASLLLPHPRSTRARTDPN